MNPFEKMPYEKTLTVKVLLSKENINPLMHNIPKWSDTRQKYCSIKGLMTSNMSFLLLYHANFDVKNIIISFAISCSLLA